MLVLNRYALFSVLMLSLFVLHLNGFKNGSKISNQVKTRIRKFASQYDSMRITDRHEGLEKYFILKSFKCSEDRKYDGILHNSAGTKQIAVKSRNGDNFNYVVDIRGYDFNGYSSTENRLVFTQYEYELFVKLLPAAKFTSQAYESPDQKSSFIIFPDKINKGTLTEQYVDGKKFVLTLTERDMKCLYYWYNKLENFVEDYHRDLVEEILVKDLHMELDELFFLDLPVPKLS
jgi:hypothetical protein